jgi:dienelactone hydrolase
MIAEYFRLQTKQIADVCLTDLTTREDWEKRRPELRRQFFDMMGLWPLPPKTDLKATVTGTVEGDGFVVEKLHFQSRPGLYVTANLYLPKPASGGRQPPGATAGHQAKSRELPPPSAEAPGGSRPPLAKKYPAILYVCGHGNVVEGGVSYGSKVFYQYHPIWFARHGYVCLILDTLELGEIPGEHHGTYRKGWWWWQARGYTPAGVELWNAIRALDYLETRPEVDAARLGLTGRSGGGATSWWVAAADERVKAVVPVAGIADLHAHLNEGVAERLKSGVIAGHCDCMYFVNTYRWDFPMVAALIAPRPLLLGNSDADDIFPVAGYRRIADKVRKVYALYGADEKFQLMETKGPHRDTPELLAGINGWMNRFLKGDPSAETAAMLDKPLKPQQLKVLDRVPADAINPTVQQTFVPEAGGEPRADLLTGLATVIGGWPQKNLPHNAKPAADITHDGVRLRAIDYTSEAGIELRLLVQTAAGAERPARVVLSVLDEPGWEKWRRDLGPAFAKALQSEGKLHRDDAMFAQNRAAMASGKVAFAAIAPRGVGPTKWAEPGTPTDVQIRRRFPLIGQTLDGQRAWDARRAVAVLATLPDLTAVPVTLHGEGDAATVALFAGLLTPAVTGFDLWYPQPTFRSGAAFLNVSRVVDPPTAVGLARPRPVTLHVKTDADAKAWEPAVRLAAGAGGRVTVKVVGE